LQEQIRDLMFFIDAKEKIASNDEMQDGSLVVLPSNKPPGKPIKKRNQKHKLQTKFNTCNIQETWE